MKGNDVLIRQLTYSNYKDIVTHTLTRNYGIKLKCQSILIRTKTRKKVKQ